MESREGCDQTLRGGRGTYKRQRQSKSTRACVNLRRIDVQTRHDQAHRRQPTPVLRHRPGALVAQANAKMDKGRGNPRNFWRVGRPVLSGMLGWLLFYHAGDADR